MSKVPDARPGAHAVPAEGRTSRSLHFLLCETAQGHSSLRTGCGSGYFSCPPRQLQAHFQPPEATAPPLSQPLRGLVGWGSRQLQFSLQQSPDPSPRGVPKPRVSPPRGHGSLGSILSWGPLSGLEPTAVRRGPRGPCPSGHCPK